MPDTPTRLSPQAVIRQVFEGLDEHELEELLETGQVRHYPSGHVLCREGEMEHTFYLLLDGQVDITIQMLDGTPRKVSQRKAGEYFGEMALIENRPRSATVTATTETEVFEFSEEVFDALLAENPQIATMVLRQLTTYLRKSDQAAIADLSRKNAELAKAYNDLQAAQAALVIKERLERELEIAAEVQQSMLPDVFPEIDGWAFSGHNEPARTVGGDLFDIIPLDEEHIGLLLADVADKSVHAALFMAVTRTLFRAEATRSHSPAETALNVHKGILGASSRDDMFVTAFYGVLNTRTGDMRYVRAGQDFPIVLRPSGGSFEELMPRGRFLGMLTDLSLEEAELHLAPGDTLVVYSDGVTDMINASGRAYGIDDLLSLLRVNSQLPARDICQAIFDAISAHRGQADTFDDATVLICQRQPGG